MQYNKYKFQQQMQIDNTDLPPSQTATQKNLNHTQIMFRINQQLKQVMQLHNETQQKTKTQLISQIQKLTRQYNQQLQSLKLKQHLQESTHSFVQQQNRIKFQELEHERDCLIFQNKRLKEEIVKNQEEVSKMNVVLGRYKNKIKNQECLIDQYKRSIEQQINLEKQVIKNAFMEKELAIKLQFDKALKCMQQNYQRKVTEMKQKYTYKEYQTQMKSVKKFCSTLSKAKSQQNAVPLTDIFQTNHKKTRQSSKSRQNSSVKKMAGNSSYSTLQK